METSECILELQHIIANAWLHSTAVLTFYDPEVQDDVKVVRRRYLEFFAASEMAHLGQAAVLLYSLLENRRDTVNFRELIALLESEGLSEGRIPNLSKALNSARPLWKKVGVLRNEVLAHRTQRRSRNDSFAKAGLTPKHLMDLAKLYKDAINSITLARDNTSWSPLMDVGPNLRRVLSILAKRRS